MTPTLGSDEIRFKELCRQNLSLCRLIMVSNRGPIEYYFAQERELKARRGSGGVVTALSGISDFIEMEWIASAMGEGDRDEAGITSFTVSFVTPFSGSCSIICGTLLGHLISTMSLMMPGRMAISR